MPDVYKMHFETETYESEQAPFKRELKKGKYLINLCSDRCNKVVFADYIHIEKIEG